MAETLLSPAFWTRYWFVWLLFVLVSWGIALLLHSLCGWSHERRIKRLEKSR